MQAALRRLNARGAAQARPPLAMGAAVNSGRAFAGVMGAPRKKKYTVLGDVVNTASRIEGQNKELGTELLLSASTAAAVEGRVTVKERGAVRVKGKAEPVALFELAAVVPDGDRSERPTAVPARDGAPTATGTTPRVSP